ncbi:DNA helicase, partial [Mesorhizobium sp. M2A.F.Ca.ET.039.01.1.1]
GLMTRAGVFASVTRHYASRSEKPFTHIVVDEAQDLGVAELRFLAAIARDEPDAMFFAGDLGQRIFQQPFSWKKLGIDVRGRSTTLKVNYRTSHQIRRAADRLLPDRMRDVDENESLRTGTVSVFEGPDPIVIIEKDETAEIASAANSIKQALADGFAANEIGIFVRSEAHLDRAFAAAEAAGIPVRTFVGEEKAPTETALLGIMHLAKGLEFRLVVLMACDEDALPLAERVADVADDFELDEVLATERQLLYVAATRARDRLIVTAVVPGSQYIDDLIGRTV